MMYSCNQKYNSMICSGNTSLIRSSSPETVFSLDRYFDSDKGAKLNFGDLQYLKKDCFEKLFTGSAEDHGNQDARPEHQQEGDDHGHGHRLCKQPGRRVQGEEGS